MICAWLNYLVWAIRSFLVLSRQMCSRFARHQGIFESQRTPTMLQSQMNQPTHTNTHHKRQKLAHNRVPVWIIKACHFINIYWTKQGSGWASVDVQLQPQQETDSRNNVLKQIHHKRWKKDISISSTPDGHRVPANKMLPVLSARAFAGECSGHVIVLRNTWFLSGFT